MSNKKIENENANATPANAMPANATPANSMPSVMPSVMPNGVPENMPNGMPNGIPSGLPDSDLEPTAEPTPKPVSDRDLDRDLDLLFTASEAMPDAHVADLMREASYSPHPKRIFQTGPAMSGRTFELLFNFNRKGDFYFIDDRTPKGLQEAFKNFPTQICRSLVFENLGSPQAEMGFHLPYKEFAKLTDPEKKTMRGHRITWDSVWFCSKLPLERLYPDHDPAELYSRIDLIVVHYLRPDMSWGYVTVEGFDPTNITNDDLQAAALAADPDAIFSLNEISPDVPNNYSYAATRFEQLGLSYHLDANGFVLEDAPKPICPDRTYHRDAEGAPLAITIYNPDLKVFYVEDLTTPGKRQHYAYFDVSTTERDTFRERLTDADFLLEMARSAYAKSHRMVKSSSLELPTGITYAYDRPLIRRILPSDFPKDELQKISDIRKAAKEAKEALQAFGKPSKETPGQPSDKPTESDLDQPIESDSDSQNEDSRIK